MYTPQASAVRYERTTAHTLQKLTDLQADILLLCNKPCSISYLLITLNALQPEAYPCDVYGAICWLQKHGLLAKLPPIVPWLPLVKLPTIPNYARRLVA